MRLAPRLRGLPAPLVQEEAEKVRLGLKHQSRAVAGKRSVCLQRTIKIEERRVLAVSFIEDDRPLRVAFTTLNRRLSGRFSKNNGSLPIGLRLNLRLHLLAFGAKLRGLRDTGRAHAIVDRLTGCFRKIGPSNTDIDDLYAEIRALRLELAGDPCHQLRPGVGQQLGESHTGYLGANDRVDPIAKDLSEVGVAHSPLPKAQRIDDAIPGEEINVDPLLIGK